jgi:hypothetical protein
MKTKTEYIEEQLYLLQMRKACSEMEHANQCAARDSARGEWTLDWSAVYWQAQSEFNDAEARLRINCSA